MTDLENEKIYLGREILDHFKSEDEINYQDYYGKVRVLYIGLVEVVTKDLNEDYISLLRRLPYTRPTVEQLCLAPIDELIVKDDILMFQPPVSLENETKENSGREKSLLKKIRIIHIKGSSDGLFEMYDTMLGRHNL